MTAEQGDRESPPASRETGPAREDLWYISRVQTYDKIASWLEYQAHFDGYSTLVGWEGTRKAWMLCARSLTAEQRADIDVVTSTLQRHFCPKERRYAYMTELQHYKKKPEETWSEMARNLQSKARVAYPNMVPDQLA